MPDQPLHDPWMIAAWPGMGNVAVGAAGYLIVKLGAKLMTELSSREMFDVPHIEVKKGIARAGRLPRNMFFEWKDPAGKRDLIIFIGEAQPNVGGYSFCHRLIDHATHRGVKRIFTFAAMASQLHPTSTPRVFGAVTEANLLRELKELGVTLLEEGQISGLNGVLLAAAAEHNLPGICLLGELPYFAAAVPNPKASQAVLEVFCAMSGIAIDFKDISHQAAVVEKGLVQLMEKMQEAARQAGETGEEAFPLDIPQPEEEPKSESKPSAKKSESKESDIDFATRRRIDAMFEAAHLDRGKAFQLKQELDRLGVFSQYENRFLDLFRKGE